MKALTLQQPWASLIAIGAKGVETRKWHPQQNPGTLVICSSKKPITGPAHERLLASEPFASCLDGHETPRSAMLAVARVSGFSRTDDLHYVASPQECDRRDPGLLSFEEWTFGDFTPGRWAWFLTDVVKLDRPVTLSEPTKPKRGERRRKSQFRLGLWDLLPVDAKNLAEALVAQNVKLG